jgi:hypothetical protein
MTELHRLLKEWDDVPSFRSSSEERAYWEGTELDSTLLRGGLSLWEDSDSTTITLRINPQMLARVKRMARQRYLNYQSMIKQWIAERMEKELRDAER